MTSVSSTVNDSPTKSNLVKDYRAEMMGVQNQFMEQIIKVQEKQVAITPMQPTAKPGEKRKAAFPDLFTPAAASKPKKSKPGPVQPKNACVALNEYKPGLEYQLIECAGPAHDPCFKMKVVVNGNEFFGEGRTKKLGKQNAAEAALKSIVQFRNPLEAQVAMGNAPLPMTGIDFTKDDVISNGPTPINTFDGSGEKKNVVVPQIPVQKKVVEVPVADPAPVPAAPLAPVVDELKNPIMSLNELKPGLTFACTETETGTGKKFTTTVTVDGSKFEGVGSSKKLSKQACARAALSKLFGANFTSIMTKVESSPVTNSKVIAGTNIPLSKFSMSQEVADQVGKMILEKFEALTAGNMVAARRKVIAGVVMSRGEEMQDLEIVCTTTGTKCINGEYMSVSGKGLNDCHAEILSRRCLMRFLYDQLESIKPDAKIPDMCVLEKREKGGYRLKKGIRFHLYINTAPCGDARIFSPHEDKNGSAGEDNDRHYNRRSRGQLRTKIESGEGTIPVSSADGIQTWDGVMQGARLLTMSCSDKVCRWNVVGVQGALLSYFLEPVYFHSIILGSLFHSTHMLRAVTGRVQSNVSGLPPPYSLNTPKLNLLSSPEARQPRKSPNHSLNWTKGDVSNEMVDATKGKVMETDRISRLCKYSLFASWLKLAKRGDLSTIQPLPSPIPNLYSQAKAGSKDFQEAKKILFSAFKKAGLGEWVKRPMEQDDFEIF